MVWVFYAKWLWEITLDTDRHLKAMTHNKNQRYIGIKWLHWLSSTVTLGDTFREKRNHEFSYFRGNAHHEFRRAHFSIGQGTLRSWSSWPLPCETLQLKSIADKLFPFTCFPFYTCEYNFKLVTSTQLVWNYIPAATLRIRKSHVLWGDSTTL